MRPAHLLFVCAMLLPASCTRTPSASDISPPPAEEHATPPAARAPARAAPGAIPPAEPAPAAEPDTERAAAPTGPVRAPAQSQPTSPAPSATAGTSVHVALSGEGLDFVSQRGSVRHFAFGESAGRVIEAVSRVQATAPERGRNEECGVGPLDMAIWPSGLTLVASDGQFVGWAISPPRGEAPSRDMTTMAGVGLGSTRAELTSAYTVEFHETSLGTEFTTAGLVGVLDGSGPAARITALWAGESCVFR